MNFSFPTPFCYVESLTISAQVGLCNWHMSNMIMISWTDNQIEFIFLNSNNVIWAWQKVFVHIWG